MQLKILACSTLNRPVTLLPGDKLVLNVYGVQVHTQEIDSIKTISRWAMISVGDALGYIVGGDLLLGDLLSAGAVEAYLTPQQTEGLVKGKTIGVSATPNL